MKPSVDNRLRRYREQFDRDLRSAVSREIIRKERDRLAFKIPQKNTRGEVYLIEANGLHKIGVSGNAKERIKGIRTAIPCPVSVLCIISSENAIQLEQSLHKQFEGKRSHGEWFNLSPDDIEYIKGL